MKKRQLKDDKTERNEMRRRIPGDGFMINAARQPGSKKCSTAAKVKSHKT